jgi:hypothetical protein
MIVDILWIYRNQIKYSASHKVVLRIDQQTISLWEQSNLPKERCLKQATRKSIKELKLVHSGNLFHILISTDSVAKDFFVGNRSYWLSETEAPWLAHELSSLLELPVRDVEVIVQSY